MLKQLRIKFVCINMAIVMVLLGALLSFLYFSTAEDLKNNSTMVLHQVANDPMRMNPLDRFDSMRKPKQNNINLPYIVIQTGSNDTLLSVHGNYFDSTETDLLAILNEARDAKKETGVLKDYSLRYLVSSSMLGTVYAFVDISGEIAILHSLLRSCLVAGILLFLTFLLISVFLSGWAVNPVKKAWEDQKQFVSDASHELKTPLTVITTNAELIAAPDTSATDRTRYTDNILVMCHQMGGLVEGLLDIARIDNGSIRANMTPVDFSVAVENALLPFEPVIFEQGLSLTYEIEPDISVKGSESHLKEVVGILTDNACKYASPLGTIQITLKKGPRGKCVLEVANEGPAIAEDDLTNIFKRFYRVDAARAMNQSYGLGLSIAKQITEEHNGKIYAKSENGWNRFFVELPLLNG